MLHDGTQAERSGAKEDEGGLTQVCQGSLQMSYLTEKGYREFCLEKRGVLECTSLNVDDLLLGLRLLLALPPRQQLVLVPLLALHADKLCICLEPRTCTAHRSTRERGGRRLWV